jgi:hypothetical protein
VIHCRFPTTCSSAPFYHDWSPSVAQTSKQLSLRRLTMRSMGYYALASTAWLPIASSPLSHMKLDLLPQFMLKYVDSTLLSAAFVCLVTLYANEREQFLELGHISLDHTSGRGSISSFRIL